MKIGMSKRPIGSMSIVGMGVLVLSCTIFSTLARAQANAPIWLSGNEAALLYRDLKVKMAVPPATPLIGRDCTEITATKKYVTDVVRTLDTGDSDNEESDDRTERTGIACYESTTVVFSLDTNEIIETLVPRYQCSYIPDYTTGKSIPGPFPPCRGMTGIAGVRN